jgi:uncharacterized protein with HEPN domain
MSADDPLYVRHILDAARQAASYAHGHVRADLDREPLLRDGLIRQIEIIGEAAGRLSENFRSRYPDVPWRDITAMRNRLIHAYAGVNLDLVWETVQQDIPQLIATLSAERPS